MFCPNINNKEVIQQFNEIVESLGGSPLTVEEFKNKDLRNQREGVDYAAMEAAYKIWDSNDGNPIDYAPNGQPSRLFSDLLKHFNGNRQLAIKAKSNTFSEAFKTWFGNWLGEDKSNVSKVVDQNGEPLIVYHGTTSEFSVFDFNARYNVFKNANFTFNVLNILDRAYSEHLSRAYSTDKTLRILSPGRSFSAGFSYTF